MKIQKSDLFLKEIAHFELISFDFFDTLFFRNTLDPEDVFFYIGEKFNIRNFPKIRKEAQTKAFQKMHVEGKKEINIFGIYEFVDVDGVDSSVLMQEEYDFEKKILLPNPEIFNIFIELIKEGKKVVITSDMYFPRAFFQEVLENFGVKEVPIFSSAEMNATKRDSGEIFALVSKHMGVEPKKILHIGDNETADVKRPRQKGLSAYHYKFEPPVAFDKKKVSIATSLAAGMLLQHAGHEQLDVSETLGFVYGGPANVGFLDWVKAQAHKDGIDKVLFLSRDGFSVEQIARVYYQEELPDFLYFYGSRTAFALAAITEENFVQNIPFLLSGADGLNPSEVLERIGVEPLSAEAMEDIGLGASVRVNKANYQTMYEFLYACRWRILRVCQRNRKLLFRYMNAIGVKDGSRIAIVDVGWSGTTQEALEKVIHDWFDVEVFGYYFCLANTPERLQRERKLHMRALVNAKNAGPEKIDFIYENRVTIEQFFSAPHNTVIGYERFDNNTITPLLDAGRGVHDQNADIGRNLQNGIKHFADFYFEFVRQHQVRLSPEAMAASMTDLISSPHARWLDKVKNFDAWGSSVNHQLGAKDY